MESFLEKLPIVTANINIRYFIMASIAFLLFYILFWRPMLGRKIQAKFPKFSDYQREVLYSLLSMTIFSVIATAVFTVLRPYTQLYFDIEAYGMPYFVGSMLIMVILHDTYFYWTHRAMHHPLLYRRMHLVHHQSINPSPWAAYAFHPLEAIVEAGIIVVIALVIPAHPLAIIIFFLFQIIYNVYGHLGFELYPKGLVKHPIFKYLNTGVAHNQHHHYFKGNYGLYFTFWDRWMGTLRADYEKEFEAVTSSKTTKTKEKII